MKTKDIIGLTAALVGTAAIASGVTYLICKRRNDEPVFDDYIDAETTPEMIITDDEEE